MNVPDLKDYSHHYNATVTDRSGNHLGHGMRYCYDDCMVFEVNQFEAGVCRIEVYSLKEQATFVNVTVSPWSYKG